MSTIDELLRQHTALDVQSLDRIYLNGTSPTCRCRGNW